MRSNFSYHITFLLLASINFSITANAEQEEFDSDSPIPKDAGQNISSLYDSVYSLSDNSSSLFESKSELTGSGSDLSGRAQNIEESKADLIAADQRIQDSQDDPKSDSISVSESETEIKIDIASDVLFDFNRWSIRNSAAVPLKEVSDIIRKHPNLEIVLTGHTDSIGSDSYNMDLSIKRAKAIHGWLIHQGELYESKITTQGQGESSPVAANTNPDGSDNPDGRQKNRRVEIRIKKS